MGGVTRNPDDGEPTVAMPALAVTESSPPEIFRWLAASRRRRRRRLALCGALGTVFVAAMVAAVSVFFPRGHKPIPVASPTTREVAAQRAPSPAQRTPDRTSNPRQMLNEIFEGRDRNYSVTASVDGGAVRISSSRPGYVYVLAASVNQSDGAPLFVAVLFPRATDTNNRVQPGGALSLPDLRWPTNAEFLAIVSDQPRDIDVLGPLAGKVICGSATACSQSYGAVVFAHDGARGAVRRPAAAPAAAAPPVPAAAPPSRAARRCSDILERASLGEQLTDDEQAFLRKDCG